MDPIGKKANFALLKSSIALTTPLMVPSPPAATRVTSSFCSNYLMKLRIQPGLAEKQVK
jgi:hypothetical protein